jgi:hypothetical protein
MEKAPVDMRSLSRAAAAGGEKLHSQLEHILEFTFNLDIVDVIAKVSSDDLN